MEPEWVTRGKTIRELVKELQSFENQELEVRISIDGGKTQKAISLVGTLDGKAVLINFETGSDEPQARRGKS